MIKTRAFRPGGPRLSLMADGDLASALEHDDERVRWYARVELAANQYLSSSRANDLRNAIHGIEVCMVHLVELGEDATTDSRLYRAWSVANDAYDYRIAAGHEATNAEVQARIDAALASVALLARERRRLLE